MTELSRAEGGRADVLVALVEVERTRTAEVRSEMTARIDLRRTLLEGVEAERDRLLVEVKGRRQSWVGRLRPDLQPTPAFATSPL